MSNKQKKTTFLNFDNLPFDSKRQTMVKINYIKCLRVIRAVKRNKSGKGGGVEGVGMLVLNSMMRERLIQKTTLKQI